ncbi:MAG: SurA N-terminal domain-containing protein, partial [Alphaproteobacteria bacterium]|nr:SurA N-terminal domain-containing protein [Alphaproteobacteria bacterium]
MLESIRKGQRWLTLLLIAFVGAVFVFFMGVGGQLGPSTPSGNAVVRTSGTQMLESDFGRLRERLEQFYRDEMGEEFNGREQSDALDALALRELVNQVVLAHSARELGIRVDREEIQQFVTQSPEFRDETGRFNKEAFVEFAKWQYGSQRAFIEKMRTDLLRQKMISLLYDQASVSPSEARDAALYGLEQRRLAYVTIDPTQLPPGDPQAEVDDESLSDWIETNDESLQAAYQAKSAQYAEPALATARHILIAVEPDADPEEIESARTRADAVRQRLAGGEDFAAVALEVSEDSGTREEGGSLGPFSRGARITEIEEVAFALQPGDLSEVFQSDSGFHVLRLDALQPERTRPFDEVAPELAREEILELRANERAQRVGMELADAIQAG